MTHAAITTTSSKPMVASAPSMAAQPGPEWVRVTQEYGLEMTGHGLYPIAPQTARRATAKAPGATVRFATRLTQTLRLIRVDLTVQAPPGERLSRGPLWQLGDQRDPGARAVGVTMPATDLSRRLVISPRCSSPRQNSEQIVRTDSAVLNAVMMITEGRLQTCLGLGSDLAGGQLVSSAQSWAAAGLE